MEAPFYIIRSRMHETERFSITDGMQPTHALFYIKDGSFEMNINGKTEEIKAGDCVIFPDDMLFHRRIKAPLMFIYIQFATNYNCTFTMRLTGGKVQWKSKRAEKRFRENIALFEALLNETDKKSSYIREQLFMDMLIQIDGETVPEKRDLVYFKDSVVKKAVEWMQEHIAEKIYVDDVCRAVSTNPSTLNFRFHKEKGMGAIEYLIEMRMKMAEYLLSCSNYSIGRIAEQCGYDNIYFFSNAFKKRFSVSPSAYRKK